MGSPKQTLRIAGESMLDRVVDTFLESSVSEVVVVVRPALGWKRTGPRLRVVINQHPDRGLSESVRVGVGALDPQTEAVVIGLGDKPLLRPASIDSLVSRYLSTKAKVVVPTCGGERGNPVLFDRSLFKEMGRLTGDSGAKELIRRHPSLVLDVAVEDRGVLLDVNTPFDAKKVEEILGSDAKSGHR
ncbi:MAG: nucleotidyltransferase family protein [Nitrososphaerota archaeon]|nr:nucleotidyltransferase family protein [Nitrososphaerota archaeon]